MRFIVRAVSLLLSLSAVTAGAQTVFVRDTFTGANGTTLQAHNPDTGTAGSWTRLLGNNLQIQSNTLRTTANQSGDIYVNTTASPNREYAIGIDVTFTARADDAACSTNVFTCSDNYVQVFGRGDVTAQNGYLARVSAGGRVVLLRVVGGAITRLAFVNLGAMTLNVKHTLVLSIKDASKQVVLNGTAVLTSADNTVTGLASSGRLGGIGMNSAGANQAQGEDFFGGTFAPTEATMLSYGATIDGDRVLVNWTTAQEKDNLGYRVWRETDGSAKVQVGPLVAGSAFLARGVTLNAGNVYRQVDRVPQRRRPADYWIEELDVRGQKTWFGPIRPEAGTIDAAVVPSPAFSALTKLEVPGDEPAAAARSNSFSRIVANAVAPATPSGQQAQLAARAAVKLYVAEEGWYRVTGAELFAAGLDRAADPRMLQLWVDGSEVAITVDSKLKTAFDATDSIRFYGTGLDTASTSQRVYWLTSGIAKGARIETWKGVPAGTAATAFTAVAERRDKVLFIASLANGENESFFGPVVSTAAAAPTAQMLSVLDIERSVTTAQLTVTLQGASDPAAGSHRVAILLNGLSVGVMQFSGRTSSTFTTPITSASLIEGTNTVGLYALNGEDDLSVVQSIRINYPHTFAARGGRLLFTTSSSARLTGFTTDVRLLDVTVPAAPLELDLTISRQGIVTADLPKTGTRRVIAATPATFARPARIEANIVSTLGARGADLVIVAPRAFIPALDPLVSLHRSEGLTVLVAPIDDVYDEFSFGAKDPAAIKLFIAALRASSAPPRAVMLVGDATFDPRNYLGLGDFDFVPTKLVTTDLLKTSSDGWFTDANGDAIPDLAIGRLPVRSVSETNAVVAKIVNYAATPSAATWSTRALLVSDIPGIGESFDGDLQAVRNVLPASMTAVNVAATAGSSARTSLLSEWNAGASFIGYMGHGSTELWTSSGLFSRNDVSQLSNGSRLPFVTAMTCLNGYFHDLYTTSLAESLVSAPNGGAIGVFASSSLTTPGAQIAANGALASTLFAGGTFGDAALAAWRAAGVGDFARSFQLFGDPMLRLRR